MKELTAMVKDSVDRTVMFYLYGKNFRVSHIEDTDEVWIDINEIGRSTKVRVKTVEELATYIRNHATMTPLMDDMILFNVKTKVGIFLKPRSDLKE